MSREHDHGGAECREMFARLSEYLDSELDVALCEKFDGHMGDCPPCQAFLKSLRATVDLIGTTPPGKLPDDLRQTILDDYNRLPGQPDKS